LHQREQASAGVAINSNAAAHETGTALASAQGSNDTLAAHAEQRVPGSGMSRKVVNVHGDGAREDDGALWQR